MTQRLVSFIAISAVFAFALMGALLFAPNVHAAALIDLDNLEDGDLIRGETYAAVYYYGADGMRYVFPNDKTYFTWYDDFDDVRWLSDSDLAQIQIGGNVTYKPGVKMIKINSDPKTYAVASGGVLRHVTSESIAIELYGANWNKMIDDVPDGFFSNYEIGNPIDVSDTYDPDSEQADAANIDTDKMLFAAHEISIVDFAFEEDEITIPAGTAVQFMNDGSAKHTASGDDGDWGTGTILSGGTFTRYFDEPGTYSYHCAYHPSMTATIEVE